MKVTPPTGQLSGSFKDAALNETFNFNGVLLQIDGSVAGLFTGTDQAGLVVLQPSPQIEWIGVLQNARQGR